ncbi:uncharacterized protein F4822DRAFT_436475 [Hypoxylon trugodes]|uniref:uncharacterized protein n=1 Tax=Hypoxylon trugodes TaxID=326681 RepID=UPI00219C1739|nr:uncharacterized protein F4822DRAFT_436475 [Hypoxylon trugodes]KAI1390759.1 hypothetical protein F4822DRAFT_436475 [Hypoxylon trugodes]
MQSLQSAAEYYDLGTFHRPVSTESSDAQKSFDRGLLWTYAFNHEEAIRCYQQVIAHDPACAMGYWGIAFAKAPNYNKSWSAFDEKDLKNTMELGHYMGQEAQKHLSSASPVEIALIGAIQHRYPSSIPPSDLKPSVQAYSNAMRQVYQKFGDGDLDIITLAADALMNTSSRSLYDKNTGNPKLDTPVLEVKAMLEGGLENSASKYHTGILHMYIHLMEMSSTPEAALIAADHLRNLAPYAESHRRASTFADDKYFAKQGPCNFYSLYRLHDYHSLVYAKAMLLMESPPMADWLEFFKAVRIHALVRFGMWDALKRQPLPQNKNYAVELWQWLTMAGQSQIRSGNSSATQQILYQPRALIFPNKVRDVLGVAAAMLDGELEYRRGNFEAAFDHLRLAVSRDDNLERAFAALLLEQGHVDKAATANAEDLGLDDTLVRVHQHPNNVWALKGYHECLVRLGHNTEAVLIKKQLTVAAAVADIPINVSCFCRLSGPDEEGCCVTDSKA